MLERDVDRMTEDEKSFTSPKDAVRCETARELIAALSPLNSAWGYRPNDLGWIFRGQGRCWPLLPSAHRPDAFNKFPSFPKSGPPAVQPRGIRATQEQEVLRCFRDKLNAGGFAIPNDSYRLKQSLTNPGEWPSGDAFPLMALAQHHGLPTSLLDWTEQSRNAAYFAAVDAAREFSPEDQTELIVWALKIEPIEELEKKRLAKILRTGAFREPELNRVTMMGLPIVIVRAPRSANPNMHAQSGLFTLLNHIDSSVKPLDQLVAEIVAASLAARATADKALAAIGAKMAAMGAEKDLAKVEAEAAALETATMLDIRVSAPGDILRAYTLPRSEAPALLRLLYREGVSGLTMFPGVGGAEKAVVEESMRQGLWTRASAD